MGVTLHYLATWRDVLESRSRAQIFSRQRFERGREIHRRSHSVVRSAWRRGETERVRTQAGAVPNDTDRQARGYRRSGARA